MSGTSLSALAQLAQRRLASFSEAAETVLDVLETELPEAPCCSATSTVTRASTG